MILSDNILVHYFLLKALLHLMFTYSLLGLPNTWTVVKKYVKFNLMCFLGKHYFLLRFSGTSLKLIENTSETELYAKQITTLKEHMPIPVEMEYCYDWTVLKRKLNWLGKIVGFVESACDDLCAEYWSIGLSYTSRVDTIFVSSALCMRKAYLGGRGQNCLVSSYDSISQLTSSTPVLLLL